MRTTTLSLAMIVLGLVLGGCATGSDGDDTIDTTSQEARSVCYSSDDCAADRYCTTEDGVCNSPCRPNQPCIDVCVGTCKKGERAPSCDYSDPSRTYYGQSQDDCAVIRFFCAEGTEAFFDDCGCGCQTP